jgi:hypothetical protein
MNVCAVLLIGIMTATSIALRAIESKNPAIHIPTALGITDKQYGMIFTDDGNHIIVGYFTEANSDEKLDVSCYTYNDNKLAKVADKLHLYKEECARLLSVVTASSDYPKNFYTQNHAIKIYEPNHILITSTPEADKIAQVSPQLQFTSNALFACAESKDYPLIVHVDQSDNSKAISIINGRTGNHTSVALQKMASARIHEIVFTRITNTSACTLALLLTRPKHTEIASINFSLNSDGTIIGQEIVPACKIRFDRLHERVSESDPAYVTSFGWTPQGDFCTLVKRVPNYTYLVHAETSECTPILRSYSYYISPDPQQKNKDDLRECMPVIVPKEIIEKIRQSPVQVSPNRSNIIVDGILIDLRKKSTNDSHNKVISFLILLYALHHRP